MVICAVFVGFEFGDGFAGEQEIHQLTRADDAHALHRVEAEHDAVAGDEIFAAS